jgi:phosphopantothenoylcysteine decarboxylase / phosphopantothenate---cysteine ligase
MLEGKRIVLGITGSISAYKAADLASKLTQTGALVDAVLTDAATRFIPPLTLRSVTRRTVFLDMFDPVTDLPEEHVELARRADAVLVAPASADMIARLAHGRADDMVALIVLATTAPVLIVPAMDGQMFEHEATQRNIETLRERGYTIVGPVDGRLASGRIGKGRLVETDVILGVARQALGRRGDLAGRRVVVTAGGTQEAIDPVRYLSNHSSGKMGYAIAEAARDRGADATLVTTPTALSCPSGVRLVPVRSADEMRDAVATACEDADALIMAAAVADFTPAESAEHKIKRAGRTAFTLDLVPTPDILAGVRKDIVRVGFKAETRDLEQNARGMLERIGLDLVVANDVTVPGAGFASDTNRVTFIDASGEEDLPLMSKYDVAWKLLDRVAALLVKQRGA